MLLWKGWERVCVAGIRSSRGDGVVLLPVCVGIFDPRVGCPLLV